MKQALAICVAVILALPLGLRAYAQEKPVASARAYVLYCPDNGEVLLGENAERRMKPASTTKLMTTLLTLEQAAQNDKTVTFTDAMIAEGSSMYLGVGEQVKLSDLATGMMLSSGNDAANAAAATLGGDGKGFARMMNARARELGMQHTHFVTPSGLDDPDHYSTAYDLALLMSAALQNPAFADLTAQKSRTVDFVKPDDKRVTYTNHNRLLSLYPDCIGGKTGYTIAAGRCLVSAARRGGLTLVCVTLDDGDDWNDHIALYDYGFDALACYAAEESALSLDVPCVGGERDSVRVCGAEDFSAVVRREDADRVKRRVLLDSFLYAPVKKGDAVGKIVYMLDGRELGSVRLLADNSNNEIKIKKSLLETIKEFFTHG